LISEWARVALAAAKARGKAPRGGRGHRPAAGPDAAAAALARREAAERTTHQLAVEVARLWAEGVIGQAAMARIDRARGADAAGQGGMDPHDGGKGGGAVRADCGTKPKAPSVAASVYVS
jgi:hypothetical protein